MNLLITGTSSGIGKGCAKYFLKNGHKVYGFDRKESTIEHPDYKHYCLDIRDKEMYPELPPMQIVINNAGVQNEDDIDINLKGTIAVTEHYAVQPEIRSVIMIGSASGHTGSEFPEYAASKGGVLSYTKNVATGKDGGHKSRIRRPGPAGRPASERENGIPNPSDPCPGQASHIRPQEASGCRSHRRGPVRQYAT